MSEATREVVDLALAYLDSLTIRDNYKDSEQLFHRISLHQGKD
jgi:hypothetical protein